MKNKKLIGCCSLVLLFVAILAMFLIYGILYPERSTFKRLCNNRIPDSVQNIKRQGYASLAGANELLWFDISPIDVAQFLKDSGFKLSNGDLLKSEANIRIERDGIQKTFNDLDFAKFQAREKGIIPNEIYLSKNASFSNYKILIVDKNRNKIFLKYIKH